MLKLRAVRFDYRHHKAWYDGDLWASYDAAKDWLLALKQLHGIESMGMLTTTPTGFRWAVDGSA